MPLTLPRGAGLGDFQHIGATADRRYIAGEISGASPATGAQTVGQLIAIPFLSPRRGGSIDRLGCNVATLGAGSSVRTGLYANTSDSVLYPGAMLLDGGAITSATTGVKEATVALSFTPSTLYWAVFECSATAPVVTTIGVGGFAPLLGMTNAYAAPGNSWSVAHTFGALPNPYTASATAQNGAQVAIGMRFSA